MGVFYVYGGMTRKRDLEWIQGAINVLIVLFRRVEMMSNVEKYMTITWNPGENFTGMSEEAFSCRSIGEASAYHERLRQSISCLDCGIVLLALFIASHHRRLYWAELVIEWD